MPVPEAIRRRIMKLSTEGKSPDPILRFYDRLQRNPSKRSVDQLFPFLEKLNIPITKDGCFLAYKSVRNDYMDKHSGTISNKPGTTVKLPRNLVSDDPREACHFGLHVGAPGYASNFADKLMVVKVDPEFVVCVPYDASQEKMRVCEYKVIGHHGEHLPDDVMDGEEELENAHDTMATEVVEEVIDNTKQFMKKTPKNKRERKQMRKAAVKKVAVTTRTEKKLDKSDYKRFDSMDAQKLMNESLDDLRKYATYGLELVGASKIPGGKAALVSKLLKIRKKQ